MTLLLDGEIERVLSDLELDGLLGRLPGTLGLHAVGDPVVLPHSWGPSGYQMLSESHFAFDYWHRNFVTMELFSCKPFPVDETVAWLVKEFAVTKLAYGMPMVIRRGMGLSA